MSVSEKAESLGLDKEDRLLNCRQVAELLGVSVSSVRMWRFKKIVEPVRIGRCVRFRASDIKRIQIEGLVTRK